MGMRHQWLFIPAEVGKKTTHTLNNPTGQKGDSMRELKMKKGNKYWQVSGLVSASFLFFAFPFALHISHSFIHFLILSSFLYFLLQPHPIPSQFNIKYPSQLWSGHNTIQPPLSHNIVYHVCWTEPSATESLCRPLERQQHQQQQLEHRQPRLHHSYRQH